MPKTASVQKEKYTPAWKSCPSFQRKYAVLQDNIRQLIKLFAPEGVELRWAWTALWLLPPDFSAPWRVLELYYFGVIVASEGIHPHHIMTKTINNNHWWQCWMASAYRANPCATVCWDLWSLRLRCCGHLITTPSGSNKNLTKSSTQSISKLEACSHSLMPALKTSLFWCYTHFDFFFSQRAWFEKLFISSFQLCQLFSNCKWKKIFNHWLFFLIDDLSSLIIIVPQP